MNLEHLITRQQFIGAMFQIHNYSPRSPLQVVELGQMVERYLVQHQVLQVSVDLVLVL
ncbi:MAG: hypothetical protein CM15mV22_2050 [Eurybiavirus sp.]|nr:MAG: hypothetical protein CM15mV22_2050 [Eurybiavirus sp.]